MTDTTDIEPARVDAQFPAPQGPLRSLLPSRDDTDRIWRLATQLQHTEFVPQAMQGRPDKILAAVLTGREMGVPPMRALKHINIIEGEAQPSAELHLSQALKAGHRVEVIETTRERCIVEVHRADWPDDKPARQLEWTLEDAERAELCQLQDGKPRARSQRGKVLPWEKYPRAMLRARALTEAIHAWMPDAIEGLDYLPPIEPDAPAPVATVQASDGVTHSVDTSSGEILDASTGEEDQAGGDQPADTPAAEGSGEGDEVERLIAELQAGGDDIDPTVWRENASRTRSGRQAVIATLTSRLDKLNTTHGPANEADQDDVDDGGQPEFPFDAGGPADQEVSP